MTIPELRALLERATPGPWSEGEYYADEASLDCDGDERVGLGGGTRWTKFIVCYGQEHEPFSEGVARSNAALIAAAVNALPALLDAVEAAKKMLDESCMARDDGDHTKDDWIVHHKDRAAFDAAVARLNGA